MRRLLGLVVVIIAMAAGAACAPGESNPQEPTGHGADYGADGSYVSIPDEPLGPSSHQFTDTAGDPWSFTDVPDERIALVYFGYTSCPDVCPLTMADVAVALRQLDSDVSERIDVVMVSTDPTRDTAEQLDNWLGGISSAFTGVRGPIEDVIEAALAYGISVEAPVVTDDAYEVSHGAQLIVLEPGGGMIGYFRDIVGVDAYVDQLPALLEQHG